MPRSEPQEPSGEASPVQVIMLNLLKMTWAGTLTVEEANQFLDGCDGFPADQRFWQYHTTYKNGRSYIHHIRWADGHWQNGSREHRAEIESIRTGKQ
ncbi:hypothetical protein GS415_04860 [Rhodococcus hoagii]|nr:hypothetical protein [Prescottella equi]